MTAVLVLNAGYERLHYVTLRHAIGMLVRQVAVVEVEAPGRPFGPWPRPAVVRLLRYVRMTWQSRTRPSWSRRGLLRRDRNTCAYCGGHATTVDHVLPRSRGGDDSWSNTVAACPRCNHRKRDRTPLEAGMALRFVPRVPTWSEILDAR